MKQDDPEGAVDEFLGVPTLEDEKGDWYVSILSRLFRWHIFGLCAWD